jgi:acyl-CoA dehydrogenase
VDFTFSEEQQELQGLTRQILGDRMTLPHLRELDGSDDWFDRETWAELAKANLLGAALPERVGGLGYGFLELCLMLEEQGRAVAPLPLLHTLVSAALPVAEFGTERQQEELGGIVTGDTIATAALSELGTPADDPQTVAQSAGDGWRITGEKVCVPFAATARVILVPARVGEDVGLFLVAPDAAGVTLARQETMNHEPQFVMKLDGVEVPDFARVGDIARGRDILRWTLERTMTGLCAITAGACQEALRITAEYTTNRKQFDRAIGTFQAVGQRMADSYIDTEAVSLTMLQAATHLAEGQDAAMEVATAKYWASEGGSRVAHACLHVHGGISIDLDYPIHRYFLWIKQCEFTLGAATPSLRDLGRLIAAS